MKEIKEREGTDMRHLTGAERERWLDVRAILVTAVVTAVLCRFVLAVMLISGNSMQPTFGANDLVVASRLYRTAERGDVVVVSCDDVLLIKRVIAVAGDAIDIDYRTGVVAVNGDALDEPYIAELTHNDLGLPLPAIVPENAVFVMGDNRNHSVDSRDADIGMVPLKHVKGKVVVRLFPFTKIGSDFSGKGGAS